MKKLSSFILIALAAGIIPLAAQDNAPRIVFDSLAKDFGKVTGGATLKHVFRFKNEGPGRLEILRVAPS